MTFFGLPALTALFVFGGFSLALIACILFAMLFDASSDRWLTIDDLFRKRRSTKESEATALRH